MDVGADRGDDGVGIRPLAVDHLAVFFQADGDAGLRVGAFGDGADRVQRQGCGVREELLDGVEAGIDRPVAGGGGQRGDPVNVQFQLGFGRGFGARPQVE